MLNRVVHWLPAAALMATIVYLSGQPSPDVSDVDSIDYVAKKAGHLVGYAALAVSFAIGLRATRWSGRALPIAFALAVAFAISDEVHQAFTNRTSSVLDVGIDAVGAAIGLWLFALLSARYRGAARPSDPEQIRPM